MKINPKFNIGDLVMCKSYLDKNEKEYKNVIGWITDVRTYMDYENVLVSYRIQWADKPEHDTTLMAENDVILLRNYLNEQAGNRT